MEACCKERSGKHPAIICNGVYFFLGDSLSNAMLIPEKNRYKYAFGVALVTYLIGMRMKNFQEQGGAGVSKELIQMHGMSVFCTVTQESLSKEERKKAFALLMFLKEKRDTTVKA
jgi:hypothetical protein